MNESIRDLELAIEGDASRLDNLRRLSGPELHWAWEQSSRPKVTRAAVLSVFMALRDSRITPDQASHWAVFASRGYIPGPVDIRPIDTEYEPADDDAIVDALNRLEGVNDEIDGPLEPEEFEHLIDSLRPEDTAKH